jgi:hypothetical protein
MKKLIRQWHIEEGKLTCKPVWIVVEQSPSFWIKVLLWFRKPQAYHYEDIMGIRKLRLYKTLFGKEYVLREVLVSPIMMNCRCRIDPINPQHTNEGNQ